MGLDRFSRIGSHVGRQRAQFLDLGRKHGEPIAPIGYLHLYDFGDGLRSSKAPRNREARIDVALGDFDQLVVEASEPCPAASKDLSRASSPPSSASLECS